MSEKYKCVMRKKKNKTLRSKTITFTFPVDLVQITGFSIVNGKQVPNGIIIHYPKP